MPNETKFTTEKWVVAGCTIYTADNWKDGRNYGGQRVGCTFDLESDDCPTDDQAAMAEQIAREHNERPQLFEALETLAAVCGAYDNGQMLPTPIVVAAEQAKALLATVQGKGEM